MATFLSAIVSIVGYGYFVAMFIAYYAFAFPPEFLPALPSGLAAYLYPYTMFDAAGGAASSTAAGVAIDGALMLAFGVAHSLFARTSVKRAMRIPVEYERSFYVLQSSALLHVQMAYWVDFGGGEGTLWRFAPGSGAATAACAGAAAGFLFCLTATLALDHFRLVGLSQGFGVDLNKTFGLAPKADGGDANGVVARWHYGIVAHPIMSGMMLLCVSTPVMTLPRLLFGAGNILYMYVAVTRYEEPQLEREMGAGYSRYLASVPRFCPLFPAAKAKQQ